VNITPYGAAGEVTGSCYHIHTDAGVNVLVDFGMFQGSGEDEKNVLPPGFDVRKLDAVLLTHAHLDHTGRLPLLAKAGYAGPIYCTPATIEMAALILRDSAHLQQQDAERHNRKLQRAGRPTIEPIYAPQHVEQVLGLMKPVPYNQPIKVAPGVTAQYFEAGHMLGSTSIQVTATGSDGQPKVIGFSGDLGPLSAPQLRDFDPFHKVDLVFMESTYGDRDHRPFEQTVEEFVQVIKTTTERRGKILIPTFAIGRAQVLTLLLGWMFREKMVKPFPVYLDSPMAIEAWGVWNRHRELFDAQTLEFLRNGSLERDLATMKLTQTADESKKINECEGPCLVMAGAGMCNGGRILHHLRNNLWKESTSVVIVGYQAEGSLGRLLVDGRKMVKIFGEEVAVKASVHTLNGFSAHAGQTDLLKWFSAMAGSRPRVCLTHGEERARRPLSDKIKQLHGIDCRLPMFAETVTL
jgi:metallo-beta-lactamase family protein